MAHRFTADLEAFLGCRIIEALQNNGNKQIDENEGNNDHEAHEE